MAQSSLVAAFLVALGCATAPPPSPPSTAEPLAAREENMLLLLEDTRLWEPVSLERALTQPRLRPRVARILGRLGDPRGERYLVDLVDDAEEETVLLAAEALAALVPDEALTTLGEAALQRVVARGSEGAAHLAVGALTARGADLATLEDLVAERAPAERLRRLTPALLEAPPADWVGVVRPLSGELPLRERRALAWAFAAFGTESEEWAVELQSTDDDWLRSAGWRAQGRLAGRAGCASLSERALGAEQPESARVRAAALGAVAACLRRGELAAGEEQVESVVSSLEHSDVRVRLEALRLARFFTFADSVASRLTSVARSETTGHEERRQAVESLVRAGDPRGVDALTELQRSPQDSARLLAASVLDQIEASALDGLFLSDPAAAVRAAAVRSVAARGSAATIPWRELLSDSSPEVRIATLLSLVRRPELTLEELLESIGGAERADREPRVRLALVEALVARARRQRMERGGILLMLSNVARDDPSPVVRRLASRRLVEAGEERIAWRPTASRRSETYYEGMLDLAESALELTWATERGDFVLSFDCRRLELLCRNLEQLAGQGFYGDTRVGDGEVGAEVRLGDPTATGHGGPGYFVRDASDARLSRHDTGLVWWDRQWPDAGGSRLVVGLAPRPLAGALPVGRVVSGMDTLSVLQSGDRILGVSARRAPPAQ